MVVYQQLNLMFSSLRLGSLKGSIPIYYEVFTYNIGQFAYWNWKIKVFLVTCIDTKSRRKRNLIFRVEGVLAYRRGVGTR